MLPACGQCRAEVAVASVIVAAATVQVPAMATTVGGIEVGPSEVEVVTVGIAGVDAEVPVAGFPVERTVEIGSGTEGIPLPAVEDVTQVEVAALPVGAEHVVVACHSHQVVEVYLVGSLVLGVRQVQLVSHLVGQEQGLVAGLLVAHCTCRQRHGQHGYQCEYHLLHNRNILISLTCCFYFTMQRNNKKPSYARDFP